MPARPRFGRSRPCFRPSPPRTHSSSTTSTCSSNSDDGLSNSLITDTIGGVTIHLTKLGRSSASTSPNPQCTAWKADMKVYLDAKGMGDFIRPKNQSDNFTYIEEEVLAKLDRERKAMIWFSVEESVRAEHLLDLCERRASSEDVWRRLHEKLGGDEEYKPLPALTLDVEL